MLKMDMNGVDLGLPSGLKWATMNVGATSVTDYGKYYAWGETKAYGEEDQTNERNYSFSGTYAKTDYGWSTYKWADDDNGESFSKYTNSTKTTLDKEDDAATQNWGGAWRMPTHIELQELLDNCYWVWTSSYNGSGIAGYIVYAVKSPSDKGVVITSGGIRSSNYSLSDAHIFLPAAGCRINGISNRVGTNGYYWSSSVCFNTNAFTQSFYSYKCEKSNFARFFGYSVRAVCK